MINNIYFPFEIPYNFDKNLITFLSWYPIYIHSIYISPYPKDYIAAKQYYINSNTNLLLQLTRKEYEDHISFIRNYFPNKLMLLLQQNNNILTEEQLDYYINLGFTKFCVGSIEQAKQIKQKCFAYEVIGSILMKIEKEKITDKHNLYFDGFVLWFPFNRNLPKIKEMPKNFKYILLVNCKCNINCPGSHHWITKSFEEEKTIYCPNNDPKIIYNYENSICIQPQDLWLFQDDIYCLKLQGREYKTEWIIKDIIAYTQNITFYTSFYDPDYKKIYKIKD